MACGDPEDIECAGVLRDVWLFLDDELYPAKRSAVEAHLDGCSPCLEEANLDQKLKALLQNKCGGDRAPEQLRARLVQRLQSVSVTTVSGPGFSSTTTEVRTTEY